MTPRQTERKIEAIDGIRYCIINKHNEITLHTMDAKPEVFRQVAEILEQAGKEDGKAGGDFQNGNNQIERGGA